MIYKRSSLSLSALIHVCVLLLIVVRIVAGPRIVHMVPAKDRVGPVRLYPEKDISDLYWQLRNKRIQQREYAQVLWDVDGDRLWHIEAQSNGCNGWPAVRMGYSVNGGPVRFSKAPSRMDLTDSLPVAIGETDFDIRIWTKERECPVNRGNLFINFKDMRKFKNWTDERDYASRRNGGITTVGIEMDLVPAHLYLSDKL